MIVSLFLALTNIVTTSLGYDDSIESPFRVESVYAVASNSKIKIGVDYFINTKTQTNIALLVNGNKKQKILSDRLSTTKINTIFLELPNTYENTKLDILFTSSWGQIYRLDADFFFHNQEIDQIIIEEPGDYKYKFINSINFANKTGVFKYGYDIWNFTISQPKQIEYYKKSSIINFGKEISKYKINLQKNGVDVSNALNSELPYNEHATRPGLYDFKFEGIYEKGGINKRINILYNFEINKNFIGECEESYYCLIEGEQNGKLSEIKKINFVL